MINGFIDMTTTTNTDELYSKPELIDTIVYPDCIEKN